MLNQYFIIISVIVLGGIGYVVYSLMNDKASEENQESHNITEMLSDKNIEINLSSDSNTQSNPPKPVATKKTKKSLFGKSKPEIEPIKSFDSQFDLENSSQSKSFFKKKFFDKLKNAIPFLKKEPEPTFSSLNLNDDDEIMQTMRANLNLTKKPESQTPQQSYQTNTPTQGTASLRIDNQEDKDATEQPPPENIKKSDEATASQTPPSILKVEKENTNNDIKKPENIADNIKQKYTQQEKILKEQNSVNTKINQELQNEIANRKSFDQVKSLLEKELAETKETSRKAINDIKIADQKSISLQNQIQEMATKIKNLEQKLSQKENEIEDILRIKEPNEVTPNKSTPTESISIPLESLNLNPTTDNNAKIEDSNNSLAEISIKDPWADQSKSTTQQPTPPITDKSERDEFNQNKNTSTNIEKLQQKIESLNLKNEDQREANPTEDIDETNENKFINLKNDILKPTEEETITLDLQNLSNKDTKQPPNLNDNPPQNKDT